MEENTSRSIEISLLSDAENTENIENMEEEKEGGETQ